MRLERAFLAPPADMWLRLQATYDLRRAARRLKNAPVRRLRPLAGKKRAA